MRLKKYPSLNFNECEQGSPEWFSARAGSLGSSSYKTAVAKGRNGAKSKTREALLHKMVREAHTGEIETWGETSDTRWGHRYEAEAIAYLEDALSLSVATVGLVTNDNYQGAHDSPDGVILTHDGLFWVEVKCLKWGNHCKYLKQAAASDSWCMPAEHRLQGRHHSVILGAAQGYCLGGFFVGYYPEDKAREFGHVLDDDPVEQVIRFVPPPSSAELWDHLGGLAKFSVDLESLMLDAEKIVADYKRQQEIDRRSYLASCQANSKKNESLIKRIS